MTAELNPLVALKRQLAGPPLLVGAVVSGGGAAWTVQLPDGSQVSARGAAGIGQTVFVRGDLIESQAPSLPTVFVEV